MTTEIGAVNLRQNLGEILSQVEGRRDGIVITRYGKPVAALVDVRLFVRIRRMQSRFDDLCNRIGNGFAEGAEVDGILEIDAAVRRERFRMAKRELLRERRPSPPKNTA